MFEKHNELYRLRNGYVSCISMDANGRHTNKYEILGRKHYTREEISNIIELMKNAIVECNDIDIIKLRARTRLDLSSFENIRHSEDIDEIKNAIINKLESMKYRRYPVEGAHQFISNFTLDIEYPECGEYVNIKKLNSVTGVLRRKNGSCALAYDHNSCLWKFSCIGSNHIEEHIIRYTENNARKIVDILNEKGLKPQHFRDSFDYCDLEV